VSENMYCKAQKANTPEFRKRYDDVRWDSTFKICDVNICPFYREISSNVDSIHISFVCRTCKEFRKDEFYNWLDRLIPQPELKT